MPKLVHSTPKYRLHKASGQAIVTIDGKDHYLGRWNSASSKAEYDRLVAEWLANNRRRPTAEAEPNLTVTEMVAGYWRFAQRYYVKNGRPTETLSGVKAALRFLRQSYGHTKACDFGPLSLKALQHQMARDGHSRSYVNGNVGRIKRAFKWAASEELLPASVHDALAKVEGLKKGRSEAREPEPVEPAADEVVDATVPRLPPVVADMVRFQRLVGCRPIEVCMIRPCEVDCSHDVWEYCPTRHKTEHRGRQRVIFIGPKAQEVLRPYLLRDHEDYCFSPAESRRQQIAASRIRPRDPVGHEQAEGWKHKPQRQPGDHYTRSSYNRAIRRACEKSGIPRWRPNQLRHSVGTTVRKQFGVEGAQVVLGHSNADVTQVYAERDFGLAREIVRKIG